MTRSRLLALALLLVPALHAGAPPLASGVESVGFTVSSLDRSEEFYSRVLGFEKTGEWEAHGDAAERLTGVFGARIRTARLRLGDEFIELTEFLTPPGRPVPWDSRSNDLWFQHIAIVTTDIADAYKRLRSFKVRHVSPAPQTLPDWNLNAGGISAFYFQDPDGHVLEIIQFPAGKGDPRWRRPGGPLFLGIDHTAIAVSSTEDSLRFYRDTLGLRLAGESENYGPEQERLNSVFGARLRITSLRGSIGPGVEFLEYLAPGPGRPYPATARSNDLFHWQTRFAAPSAARAADVFRGLRAPFVSSGAPPSPYPWMAGRKSVVVRDPDGHAIEVAGPDQP
jgi:catechol 2,3-dioxygenase-like lactoylglutathione lyase family enzyme